MADKSLNVRIKLRSDLTANWETVEDTFKPLEGEVILYMVDAENQSGYFKVGDGEHYLQDLPWWYGPRDEFSYDFDEENGAITITYPLQPGEVEPKVDTIPLPFLEDLGTAAYHDVASAINEANADNVVLVSQLITLWNSLKEGAFAPVASTLDPENDNYDGDALVTADLANTIGGGQNLKIATELHHGEPGYDDDAIIDSKVLYNFYADTLNAEEPNYDGDKIVTAGVAASRIDGVREDMVILENNLNQDISDANDRIDDLYDRLSGMGEAAFCDVATMSDLDPDNPAFDYNRLVPAGVLAEVLEGLGDLDALHFKGVYDPNNIDFTPQNGDVIVTNNGKEYVWYNNAWQLFGDENAYVINDQNYQMWKANVDDKIALLQFTQTLEQGTSGYNSDGIVKAGVLKAYIATNYTDSASEKNKIVSMQALTKALEGYGGDQIRASANYDEGTKIGDINITNRLHSVDEIIDFYVPTSGTLDRSDSHYDSEGFIPAGALSDFTLNSYSSTSDSVEREKYINLAALQDAMSQVSDLVSVNPDYSADNNMQRIATITLKDLRDNTYSDTEIYIPQPWYDNATSGGVNVGTLYFGNDYYEITVPEVSVNASYNQGVQIGSITVGSNTVDLYAPDNGGSDVSVSPTLSTGTKIAEITVDGTTTEIYAPTAGQPVPPYEYLSQMTGANAPNSGYDDVVIDGGGAPI